MQQIVDLEKDSVFNAMDISLVSLSTDPVDVLQNAGNDYGVTTPLLSDPGKTVSENYDVLKWATPSGEPSHTFILLNQDGEVVWIQDYGHPDNGGRMYVPLEELNGEIANALNN